MAIRIRIAQQGRGEARDLVVVYYLDARCDPQVLAAAGPDAIVCNDTRQDTSYLDGGVEPLSALVPRLEHELGCSIRSTTLCGFSAGCRGVRTQLRSGAPVDAVVLADGTHASLPPRPEELTPWLAIIRAAQQREAVVAASHTMLTYVEHLPRPYSSTWSVLKRLTGFDLPAPDRGATRESNHGYLTVRSYGSGTCDPQAHGHQGRVVLPELLAVAMGQLHELLERTGRLVAAASPEVEEPWHDPQLTLGQRAVAWSLAQVDRMRERPPGSNAGPDVARVLAPAMRGGKRLGLERGNWCAAFACAADAEVRLPTDPQPVHAYRCSGIELEQDARAAGAWRPVALVRTGQWLPKPGDIVLWQRGASPTSWQRHVARVVSVDGLQEPTPTFVAVGGNEADSVRVGPRFLQDPQLRGFVELPRHPACLPPQERLEVDLACVDVLDDGEDTVTLVS